jgi:SAM-dependent methyltransferase
MPPFPPPELMQRVGRIDDPDLEGTYDRIGRSCRERLERLLPEDWSWEGKTVLDFGCGAGRTLRHLLDSGAELHGCEIDGPSVAWLAEHLSPPVRVVQNTEAPDLPHGDGTFDLVYAFSVFTHLTDHWAGWLLELHRVLKPNGLLFATFLSEAVWLQFDQGPWDEDSVGMNVIKTWNPWDSGGPVVFHSEWWIREHWGRAFEIVALEPRDPDNPEGHAATLLRRRPERLRPAELERPSADPRELEAIRTNVKQLHREASELFAQLSQATSGYENLASELASTEVELQGLRLELAEIAQSRSWRLTKPLRAATAVVRNRRRG